MADRYYDPAASGANNGTSWADAWETLQDALTNVAAGDIVYSRGAETVTATPVSAVAGTNAAPIFFIGCNAGGTEDGTPIVLTKGGAGAVDGMDLNHQYYVFRNFHWTGFQYNVDLPNLSHLHFINCKFSSSTSYAVVSGNGKPTYINCTWINNAYCINGQFGRYHYCRFHANTNWGAVLSSGQDSLYHGCVVSGMSGNSATDQNGSANGTALYNVFDGTAGGGDGYGPTTGTFGTYIGNRYTNNATYGFELKANQTSYIDYNFFSGNGTGDLQVNGTNLSAGDNNVFGAADGYVGGGDFTLTDTATSRRTAVTVGTSY